MFAGREKPLLCSGVTSKIIEGVFSQRRAVNARAAFVRRPFADTHFLLDDGNGGRKDHETRTVVNKPSLIKRGGGGGDVYAMSPP